MKREEIYTLTSDELDEVEHHPIMCQREKHLGELCGCEVSTLINKIKNHYTEGIESKESILNILNTKSKIEIPQNDGTMRVFVLKLKK